MSVSLYFPTVAQDGLSQQKAVLCSLTLKKEVAPGLYPSELSNKEDHNFWQPLLQASRRLPIELNSRGFTVTQLKFSGPSATGCVSFFEKYDLDSLRNEYKELHIAISTRARCNDDGVDIAQKVSDMEEKVNLCIREQIDIFVVSQDNEKDLCENGKRYDILKLDSVDREELRKRAGKKLLILLAGRDWEKKLADILGIRERENGKRFFSSPVEEKDTQEMRLYELYITALAGDVDNDRKMLRAIFQGNDKIPGNTRMGRNTFPWKVMHDQDEETKKSYRELIFGEASLVLSGSTSTGKTTLAKALMLHALAQGQRTVYIAPTRALVYEVYQDFCSLLEWMRTRARQLDDNRDDDNYQQLIEYLVDVDDSKFVLSTGEKNEKDGQVLRGDYRILFSVYEKANLFMDMMSSQEEGRRPEIIIIDELHMLCDRERGGILDLFIGKVLSMPKEDNVRLIGITTESKGANTIKEFLCHLPKEAVCIDISQRPLPVDHYLLVGGKKFLIARLHGSVHKISREEQRLISRALRTEKSSKFDPVDMLCSKHPDSNTAHKKVIGVYNSITAIYRAVENLSQYRSAHAGDGEFCSKDTIERLQDVLDTSFINGDEKKILLKGIKFGIFVYYSPLDYKLREAMAEAFRKDCDKTQILLTTEALAYGVNFPADAIYLTYIRESDSAAGGRGGDFIKRNLFFNILGRVGRLGKSAKESACCAFVILNESGVSLESDIKKVLNMYSSDSAFQINTLDKDTEDGILERDTVWSLDDISFISFRSSLDALRFVTLNKKEKKRASVREVRSFLERTIYGWQFCSGLDPNVVKKHREDLEKLLSTIYKLTSDACPFQKNKLVESSTSNGDIQYNCTDLASALIDTGISWKAIEPMSRWLQDIKSFKFPLPVELLLVGMLPVEELWDSIRSFDMLARDPNVSSTPTESNERAQNWLREEVDKILPQGVDKKEDIDKILGAVSDYVEKSCQDIVLSPRHKHMLNHETRLNSFSRLLAALLAWGRGASSDEIQKFAFPRDKRDLVNSFSPRYGERVCWLCLLCLRFFSKTRDIRLHPEHEGALQNLAMRMRYGVPSDCIPLMGTGKHQQNRTTVLTYRAIYGTTLQTVMQYSFDDYRRMRGNRNVLNEKIYAIIKKNAIEYYCRAALDFCDLLMRGNLSETAKSSLEKLQEFFNTFKQTEIYNIDTVRQALCGMLRPSVFSSDCIGDRLIIKSKIDSAWELVIILLDPFDSLVHERDWLNEQKKNAASRDEYEEAKKFAGLLKQIGDVQGFRESIAKNMSNIQEHIYVWMPWNTHHDIPALNMPTLNLMSLVLLLRQLEDTGLSPVRKWIERLKENGAVHLRIQQLIASSLDNSSAPEAIKGLRESLSGDILQGVLQMEEPVFPYAT